MKVVLTHAYYLKNDLKEQKIMKPYPPLGILYISAWLEQNKIKNDVFDSTFTDLELHRNYLLIEKPDIIAIYTNLITKPGVASLIKFIKSSAVLNHSKVILGGPDVTYNIEGYLGQGADVLVIGEGEQTMLELVRHYENSIVLPLNQINGIAYKDKDGKIIKTPSRQKIPDIDLLPYPARNKIDLNQYLSVWKKNHGKSSISVSTQRGCPYTCKWCSSAVYGQSYRRRSPKIVVDELEELNKVYNHDQIWFVDDVFTISHKWLHEFKDELISRKLNISFECITRADRMNHDVIKSLKEAGCFRVWIGAESGSQKILDAMDRRVDVTQVQNMIKAAKKEGIETGTFIMLGYPGETEEDIMITLDHLRRSNPDHFTITVAYPIKGTALYDLALPSQSKLPWAVSTDRDIGLNREYPRKYYSIALRWVVNNMRLFRLNQTPQPDFFTYLQLICKIKLLRIGMKLFRLTSTKS